MSSTASRTTDPSILPPSIAQHAHACDVRRLKKWRVPLCVCGCGGCGCGCCYPPHLSSNLSILGLQPANKDYSPSSSMGLVAEPEENFEWVNAACASLNRQSLLTLWSNVLPIPPLTKPSANMSLVSTQCNRLMVPCPNRSRTETKCNLRLHSRRSHASVAATASKTARASTTISNCGCKPPCSSRSIISSGDWLVPPYIYIYIYMCVCDAK